MKKRLSLLKSLQQQILLLHQVENANCHRRLIFKKLFLNIAMRILTHPINVEFHTAGLPLQVRRKICVRSVNKACCAQRCSPEAGIAPC